MVQAYEYMSTPVETAASQVKSRLGVSTGVEYCRHVSVVRKRHCLRHGSAVQDPILQHAMKVMFGCVCRAGMDAAARASSTLASNQAVLPEP